MARWVPQRWEGSKTAKWVPMFIRDRQQPEGLTNNGQRGSTTGQKGQDGETGSTTARGVRDDGREGLATATGVR